MNNGAFEVDVEDAEHVDCVEDHAENHKPCFSSLEPFSSPGYGSFALFGAPLPQDPIDTHIPFASCFASSPPT